MSGEAIPFVADARCAEGYRYRGWKVVAALFIVGMMVYGCGLYSFTLFITPLTAEFGWSRATTSGLVSIYWLAAPLTLIGEPLMRKLGSVRLIASGIIFSASATFALGLCDTLPLLFTLRFCMGVGKILMASGVTLLAAQWFNARFGLALACCYAGWHFGGIVMVPITQLLIDIIGWRETTFVLGIALAVISLPPLMIWARTPPPVSDITQPEAMPGSWHGMHGEVCNELKFVRVLKEPILWLSIAVTVFGGFAYGGILSNEAALVDEMEALVGMGALAVSLTAFAALCSTIAMGWLADRLSFLRLALIELGLMLASVLCFFCLYAFPHLLLLLAAALCFGLAIGGFEAAVLPNLRRSLEPKSFDHAFGIWYLCYLITMFTAPIGVGWIRDRTLDYTPALSLLALLTLLATIPVVMIGRGGRSYRE